MVDNTGSLIKKYRVKKDMSLRDLGEKSNLSASYLSMVERGLTSINISSLQNVARALDIEIYAFFDPPPASPSYVIRSNKRPFFQTEGSPDIYYSLASMLPQGKGALEPIIVQMMPEKEHVEIKPISHAGEEFGYVIDGIVTVQIENMVYELYPEDNYHILSNTPHTVRNLSNRLARVLYVNTPKFFQS